MENFRILWADDEIDLLKPHVLFLEEKGYQMSTVNSGNDALDLIKKEDFDLIFLDENMPGLSGIETLSKIKNINADIPVVMVTKSEEESIMEDAIGAKIADYLIKPVNPKQLLLAVKKNLDNKRLISEKTNSAYQQDFRNISLQLSDNLDMNEWMDVFRKLTFWELELEKLSDSGMVEVLSMQKREANTQFCKFIEKNYVSWVNATAKEIPIQSHTLFAKKIAPLINNDSPLFMVVIDNLRYDQWKVIQPLLNDYFKTETEELYYSILPTATQFARNALFAGLMPSQIEKLYPKLWVNDDEEGGKNMHEEELLNEQLKRLGKAVKFSYTKVTNINTGKKLPESINNMMNNKLNVIVYNFVDMLSHARTEMDVIRELADEVPAYRSLTLSWFEHSPLFEAMKIIAAKKGRMIITTDHGTVHVKEPSKIIGDRNVNTNLRYKQGKSLDYNKKDVFEIKNPGDIFLPKGNVSTSYVFAKEDKYFVYPNNYAQFVNYYKNTFQHGGISIEEILIPFITLSAK
ncbi:MAG: PglZ domain-containing protein [Bacteroidia bacterium]|nr:PglZ domain-containing protein [Bacteroidia bacterium]MCZ2247970.1 PglZ domain-containing protein [Bacteroidia bacterium]